MDIKRTNGIEWTEAPAENFTGKVWFGPMSGGYGSEDEISVLGVQFAPGSRTDWHSHPAGQILHVVAGSGWVVNEQGERLDLNAGATVTTPANELHWHGATSDSPMFHLSITHGGPTAWTDHKVTDAEYE